MDCTQVDRLLDELMDEVIAPEDLRALEAHCDTCPACAAKLNATRDMQRLFADMAPEADVPLNVQANWRRAVKEEAGKIGGMKRFYRYAAGIAAALVVAVGATLALNSRPARELAPAAVESDMARGVAMIEADGLTEAADEEEIGTAVSRAMPMHELSMTVEDLDRTCAYVSDLVREYEGDADEQRFDEEGRPCANLYIELPTENAQEFLSAAAHYDLDDETMPEIEAAGERVSMLLVLKEARP